MLALIKQSLNAGERRSDVIVLYRFERLRYRRQES